MITKKEIAYIIFGLLLMTPGVTKASDDVAAAGMGCSTATQYGKVMMQCADGTVSVMNNNVLYICRPVGTMGELKCTEQYIGRDRDPVHEKVSK